MDIVVLGAVAAAWRGRAGVVAVVIARGASRGEQASEMASLTREVRRSDATSNAAAEMKQAARLRTEDPAEG
jgi:hypothetical protein